MNINRNKSAPKLNKNSNKVDGVQLRTHHFNLGNYSNLNKNNKKINKIYYNLLIASTYSSQYKKDYSEKKINFSENRANFENVNIKNEKITLGKLYKK